MNQQQQRMAAVGTDKELSDLLDFSMVSEGPGLRSRTGEEMGAWKLAVMGFRCAVFVCMHMCCNLFIFKLKQSCCPSSPPPFPSMYIVSSLGVQRGGGVGGFRCFFLVFVFFFLDGKFWGNITSLCVACLNAGGERAR